jgi:N-acetylglucosaminyldiphosphoundecaprenol N-acetyl-beta-D-mannosaminyltransferase
MSRVDFLGCPVDAQTMAGAVNKLEEFIRDGTSHHVAVTNANKLWLIERDPQLGQILHDASLVLPEKAIVVGGKILGIPVGDHIGGIMLMKAFLDRAQDSGYRLFFFGAKPQIVERMINHLRTTHPRLQVAGWQHGYVQGEEAALLPQRIRSSRPDVLFVAMGTPKQEFWITQHLAELGVPVCMGVGGSFDVIAGLKKDAPSWVRAVAMEWLFRLFQDPRNLMQRYMLTIPWFLRKVLHARFKKSFPRLTYERS